MKLIPGSGATVISEQTYLRCLSDLPLSKSNIRIKTNTNEPIEILGEIFVNIEHQRTKYEMLTLLVLGGSGVNLLGRDI